MGNDRGIIASSPSREGVTINKREESGCIQEDISSKLWLQGEVCLGQTAFVVAVVHGVGTHWREDKCSRHWNKYKSMKD